MKPKPNHEYIVRMGNDVDFDGNIPSKRKGTGEVQGLCSQRYDEILLRCKTMGSR